MRVIVDTSVWSLLLRRGTPEGLSPVSELKQLITEFRCVLINPVRQELLSGIRHIQQFEKLRGRLRAFPELAMNVTDYEIAAQYFNECRSSGIQGSATDFLICAVAARHDFPILTTDDDFLRYANHLPIRLHRPWLVDSKNPQGSEAPPV